MYRNDFSEERRTSRRELAPGPSQRPRPRRRRRRRSGIGTILPVVCVLLGALWVIPRVAGQGLLPAGGTGGELPKEIAAFAQENGLTAQDYPQEIVALLERNPETEEFVLNYPLEHGKPHDAALTEEETAASTPLFLQWDKRWGYLDYGDSVAALSGCGPEMCIRDRVWGVPRAMDRAKRLIFRAARKRKGEFRIASPLPMDREEAKGYRFCRQKRRIISNAISFCWGSRKPQLMSTDTAGLFCGGWSSKNFRKSSRGTGMASAYRGNTNSRWETPSSLSRSSW